MARSKNGNLLGKAAVAEKADWFIETDWSRYPDSNYWRSSAKGAQLAIRQLVGCHHSFGCKLDEILGKFWKQENTWMDICLKTEHVRDLIKALMKKEQKWNTK